VLSNTNRLTAEQMATLIATLQGRVGGDAAASRAAGIVSIGDGSGSGRSGGSASTGLDELARQAGQDAADGLTEALPIIEDVAVQVGDAIEGAITDPLAVLPDALRHAMQFALGNQGMEGAITDAQPDLERSMVEIAEALAAKENEFVDPWEPIGLNLTNALAQGITSGESAVIASAVAVARAAIEAAKDELGIESPSTEGMYLGDMFVEGMIVGAESRKEDLYESFNNLTGKWMRDVDFGWNTNRGRTASWLNALGGIQDRFQQAYFMSPNVVGNIGSPNVNVGSPNVSATLIVDGNEIESIFESKVLSPQVLVG
jgi:hypothetical protein